MQCRHYSCKPLNFTLFGGFRYAHSSLSSVGRDREEGSASCPTSISLLLGFSPFSSASWRSSGEAVSANKNEGSFGRSGNTTS